MEISKIDEAKQAALSQEVKNHKAGRRVCIYYSDIVCTAPKLQFMICRSCPKAAQFIRKNVVKSIFQHVKSLAISLRKTMNYQLSK